MGEGDLMPIGRYKKKPDPKLVQKIKEGGKRADKIRERAIAQHKSIEEPAAEAQLLKDLKDITPDKQ